MATVKIVLTIESNQHGDISVQSFEVEPLGKQIAQVTVTETQSIPGSEIVPAFVASLSRSGREATILGMLVDARRANMPVFRKGILDALNFDELLQWNGVAAWLTRRWRAATKDRAAEITVARRDISAGDYEISFSPNISDEVVEKLAEELENLQS